MSSIGVFQFCVDADQLPESYHPRRIMEFVQFADERVSEVDDLAIRPRHNVPGRLVLHVGNDLSAGDTTFVTEAIDDRHTFDSLEHGRKICAQLFSPEKRDRAAIHRAGIALITDVFAKPREKPLEITGTPRCVNRIQNRLCRFRVQVAQMSLCDKCPGPAIKRDELG